MTISGHITSAETHAKACFEALERHCGGHQFPRCGCFRQPIQDRCVVAESCEIGQVLKEEYEIASRRVRELRETGRIDRINRAELEALSAATCRKVHE